MAALESWVEIPPYATPIATEGTQESLEQIGTLPTPPSPRLTRQPSETTSGHTRSNSTSSIAGNLTNAVLTAALNVPAAPSTPSNPRQTAGRLLSTRDPLSIPITTANFRRFVSKSGAVFWLQDRVEEVIFWRKGWKVTLSWMIAYSFICYYPRLILILPHVLLLSILYVTYNIRYPTGSEEEGSLAPAWKAAEPREGSSEWFANLQAIQNLMGFYSDVYDNVTPVLPHLSHATTVSAPLLTFLVVTLLLLLPALPLLPLRPIAFVAGIFPFILTHPTTQRILPPLLHAARKVYLINVQRIIDNDRLDDAVWSAPMKEVELWENERWSMSSGTGEPGWSKANLKRGERKGWSRRRDGWSDADALGGSLEGDIRNLTFTLEKGWHFVMSEDWRVDLAGTWVGEIGADPDGWVYTNDVWNEPRCDAPEELKSRGMTRRRRWTRRIYHVETKEVSN